jgi:hypothetical protein
MKRTKWPEKRKTKEQDSKPDAKCFCIGKIVNIIVKLECKRGSQ